jgi:aerobic carbon-monoxide dehydrogenase medium subunit
MGACARRIAVVPVGIQASSLRAPRAGAAARRMPSPHAPPSRLEPLVSRVKPPPFEYLAPRSLDEAVAALAEHGDEAKAMAGGQSLVPLLAFRLARPSVIVDLNGIGGLDGARLDGDTLELGALTRQRDVERLPGLRERCPMIVEAIEQVGHVAIRNRGTVGGSLAHADPAAELPAALLALDATAVIAAPGGRRRVPLVGFFVGLLTTALAPDEILVGVEIPDARRAAWGFREIARRAGDFAIAGVAAVVRGDDGRCTDARLVAIGAGDRPLRLGAAEAALVGAELSSALPARAAATTGEDCRPPDDVHASAEYRTHLVSVLTEQVVREALGRLAP